MDRPPPVHGRAHVPEHRRRHVLPLGEPLDPRGVGGVNITYKLLYNAAVAMTGGQEVAGVISIPELTRALTAEDQPIIVCSDDPEKFARDANWAPGTEVWARDRLDEAQRVLRDTPGVTVIIYDQLCAAEKRRDRKRGVLATPTHGSSSTRPCARAAATAAKEQLPVRPSGRDRARTEAQIHQASCNFDYVRRG